MEMMLDRILLPILEEIAKPDDYPEHPKTILITNDYYPHGLSEYMIWRHNRIHIDDLYKQLKGKNTLVIMKTPTGDIIRRKDKNDEFLINDKSDLSDLNSGRTMEYHIVVGQKSDVAWIDLDPKPKFDFDEVKAIASELIPVCESVTDSEVEMKYSGGCGIHLLSWMKKERDVDELRKSMISAINEYIEKIGDDRLSTGIVNNDDMMRLDVSTLHQAGSIRAAWSLNAKTGLVSLPIDEDFNRDQAIVHLPRELEFLPFKEDPNSTSGQMRWRMRDPDTFEEFKTWRDWKGIKESGLSFIVGPLLSPKGEMAVQAIRFDREEWSAEKATAWWEKNYIFFDKLWGDTDWANIDKD